MAVIGRRPLAAFFVLTYAISWAIWAALIGTSTSIATSMGFGLNVVAIAGPSIAGLIVAAALGRVELRRLLGGFALSRVSIRWVLIALALPVAMAAIAIAGSIALFQAPTPTITAAVLGVLAGEFVRILILGGPLGEEIGWRGFALPRLQERRSAWRASVVLGLIWGLWHIPLYFVLGTGQFESAGSSPAPAIAIFVLWTIGLAVLFTWLYNETRGSLIVVMLFHAAVNLGSFLPSAVASTGGASLLYGLVTWIVALVITARFGQTQLASRERVAEHGAP